MFLDCPEYMDRHGAARCGLPAAVEYRYTMQSTDGPLESVKIRCPRGHWFSGPVDSLTLNKQAGPSSARPGSASTAAPRGRLAPDPRRQR